MNTWLNDPDRDFTNLKESRALRMVGKELVEDKPTSFVRWLGLGATVVEPFSAAKYFGEPPRPPSLPREAHEGRRSATTYVHYSRNGASRSLA